MENISITDHLDAGALRHIVLCVAQSQDGATSFAKALSLSKSFNDHKNDIDLLKSIKFEHREYPQSFWRIDGLLTRCACARNMQAGEIITEYLTARTEVLRQKRQVLEEYVEFAEEMSKNFEAVRTRGRERAAHRAHEDVERIHSEIQREGEEIAEHLRIVIDSYI